MIENTGTIPPVILIGVQIPDSNSVFSITDSLIELAELARTARLHVVTMVHQFREHPHPRFYMGTGKIDEIKELVDLHHAEVVIADDELSPSQQRTLEQVLKVKVMDRTSLILTIFASRAQTAEAQLQVELAQLQYMLPRLTRMWTHLSRLGGGIGTRGPGEKQLEVDKRQIRTRISTIKEKLEKIKTQRETQRSRRAQVPLTSIAIIGYTNAGKSTLLNQLTHADVFTEDLLFATLDPTTRRFTLPSNDHILITDTVGFVQKLPHQLVSSFRATLEEVIDADLLLHVIDFSHPHWMAMQATAQALLTELGADKIPQITVFNKLDQMDHFDPTLPEVTALAPCCFISARSGQRMESLIGEIDQFMKARRQVMRFLIPYNRMDIVHMLHEYGDVRRIEYEAEMKIEVEINVVTGEKIMGALYTASKIG